MTTHWLFVPGQKTVISVNAHVHTPESDRDRAQAYQSSIFRSIAKRQCWGFTVDGSCAPTVQQCENHIQQRSLSYPVVYFVDLSSGQYFGDAAEGSVYKDIHMYYVFGSLEVDPVLGGKYPGFII